MDINYTEFKKNKDMTNEASRYKEIKKTLLQQEKTCSIFLAPRASGSR